MERRLSMSFDQTHKPPQLALRIFRWYCRPDRVEELEGDLEEVFFRRLSSGGSVWKAKGFFWWNIFRCYKSYARTKTQNNLIMTSLFKSYFKLALRHSWKNKWSVLINVTGLGLALSMCVFLYTLYAYNFEFDSFYKDTDNLYRIHTMTFENGQQRRNEASPIALEDKLRNEIAGIDAVSSYFARSINIKKGNEFFSEYAGIASTDLVDMFEMPLWYGSYEGFGERPLIYLSKPLAEKLFGNELALGEELTLYFGDEEKMEVEVGGVLQKIPLNSSFDFNLILNQREYLQARGMDPNDWSNKRYEGQYLRLNANKVKQVTEEINKYIAVQNEGHEERKISEFQLVPFLTKLNADDVMYRKYANGRLRPQVYMIFTVLIGMIFLTACFNLANTSMALIAKRLKEIGIRKTLGSGSKQILLQFLFEMGIISFLAFIIALLTANTTSGMIMGLFGVSFLLQDANLTGIILFVLGFLLFTTFVAGLLPALYAWRFQPISIMRKSVKLKGVNGLNKVLTIAQYSFSIAVLAAGITFSQNSDFLKDLNLGYTDESVFDLDLGSSEYYAQMKQEIEQIPGVVTAGTQNHLGNFGRYSSRATLEIDTVTHEVHHYTVGPGYLDLMEVNFISGRNFIEESDADQNESILVSQSFGDMYLGGKDPLHQVVKIGGERRTIVGVVSDIIDDVYEDSELTPKVFALDRKAELRHLIVKAPGSNLPEIEDRLKLIWSQNINKPYEGTLQEDLALGDAGRDTKNLQKIFVAMAILGGFLSIVGIFSLAKLNVAKRIKEISVRKVLGASINELLYSINRSFVIVLLIALVAGCSLGYFISDTVLGLIYKYYVDVSTVTVAICGLFILIMSLMAITGAVAAPANANPVKGLREE
ncbi:MAG: FtsX-like permease family protein [Cyclobacteriaceae bacterium]